MLRNVLVFTALCFVLTIGTALALEAGTGSYKMKDRENGENLTVWYFKPANFSKNTPILFVLHGMMRNPDEYRDQWKEHAEKYGLMLLVPGFTEEQFPGPNGYNLGNLFVAKTKQEVEGRAVSGQMNAPRYWSYRVVDKVFDDFKAQREKTGQAKYYLFGHSAGSQYVHRMLEFVPDAKVKMAIAANAGWYTMPDLDKDWPYGLKGTGLKAADVKRFLSFPLVILLGEKDNDPQHHQLRRNKESDEQGTNRFDRGKHFFAYGQDLAKKLKTTCNWKIQTVPGVAHSNSGMSAAAAAIVAEDAQKGVVKKHMGK